MRRCILGLAGWCLTSGLWPADQAVTAPVQEPERIVVVGDIHGDYGQLVNVLRMAGIIDATNRWTGGKTHLVQLGDVPDRGADTLKAIRLLQALEKEAKLSGGRTDFLIGNHEAMNVYGDLRYTTPGEFAAFATSDSARLQEAHYLDQMAWIKSNRPRYEWPAFDAAYRQEWNARFPLGYVEHRAAWMPKGEIWQWVSGHDAVVKIGDTLFMHAGLGPSFAGWTIEKLNAAVHAALADITTVEGSILRKEEGPLWYRGLALNPEATEGPHVEALLQHFGVRRIVVGHTPITGAVMTRFNGRVIMVDVGLSRYFGSSLACLLIEHGQAYAIHRGKQLLLPTSGLATQLAYFEQVEALEPDAAGIAKFITKLKAKP